MDDSCDNEAKTETGRKYLDAYLLPIGIHTYVRTQREQNAFLIGSRMRETIPRALSVNRPRRYIIIMLLLLYMFSRCGIVIFCRRHGK